MLALNPPRMPPGFIAEYVNEPRIRKGDVKMLPQSRSYQDADWKWLRKEFGNDIGKIYIEVRPARDGQWLEGLEQHFLADSLADAQQYAFGLLTDGTADSVWIAGRLVTYFGNRLEDRRVYDFAHYEKEEPMQRNARGGAFSETAADELKLYIDNTSELMGPRSQGEAIRQNLLRKMQKGKFDLEKSVKAWSYVVESGAKLYVKEFGSGTPGEWHEMFSVATRNAVAREMAEEFAAQAKAGEFREPGKLFGRLESNASRRYSRFDDEEEIHPEVAGFKFYDDVDRPYSGGVLKNSAMVVMVDDEGREVFLVNPLEVPRGRYDKTAPYILWFGASGPTRLFIWSDSLDDALEEAGETLAEHFPGLITKHGDTQLTELAEEAREELGEDADDEEVWNRATEDMTYTESGYITSYEWGIESAPDGAHWDAAIEAGTAISKWLYAEEYGDED